jgi:hypothetical protein
MEFHLEIQAIHYSLMCPFSLGILTNCVIVCETSKPTNKHLVDETIF